MQFAALRLALQPFLGFENKYAPLDYIQQAFQSLGRLRNHVYSINNCYHNWTVSFTFNVSYPLIYLLEEGHLHQFKSIFAL